MQAPRLAIDVMSGDYGPDVIIRGVLEAKRVLPDPFSVYLCGDEQVIRAKLLEAGVSIGKDTKDIVIEHCWENVTLQQLPFRVWKSKEHSSIIRCVTLQQQGLADATISAGDTRILMTAAVFLLGRIKGVQRPALAAFLPTVQKKRSLLLDVGANINCKPGHLVAFGMMGQAYLKDVCGVASPKVALLNIGTEPSKGTKNIFEADKELHRWCRGYCGFIEGSGILSGAADVIVSDGFAGNVILKACESFHTLAESVLDNNTALLAQLRDVLAILNPENYGAVPLLGIKGTVLKAHGSSSSKAFANAIQTTLKTISKKTFTLKLDYPGMAHRIAAEIRDSIGERQSGR
jgi:phosphate acyltransferase